MSASTRTGVANLRRDHTAAIVVLREAVAVRPALTMAWPELANAYAHLDQCVAAVEAYREVLAREPARADAHFNLGLMQKRLGRRMAAARSFHGARSRHPMLFNAAGYCVATIAECMHEGDPIAAMPPVSLGFDPASADRFCTKHALGTTPPATSQFFGAKLDGPDQVRAFFDLLRGLGTGALEHGERA